MNLDTLLRDTFVAHEDLAPDPADVLAAAQAQLDRPRAYTRLLAVAASVAVVAGAAGAAVAFTHHPSGGTRRGAPAASRDLTLTGAALPGGAGIADLTMPYDLGWLPDGTVDYLARRINVGGTSESSAPVLDGEYLLTVTDGNRTIDLDIEQMPGALDETEFKSGAGEQTTIGGRPGVQSTNSDGPGGYELYFTDSAGGVIYVNASAGPSAATSGTTAAQKGSVPAGELEDIGRSVASHIEFPGTAQVTPSFGVGDAAGDLSVRAFDIESGDGPLGGGPSTEYELGPADDPMKVTVAQDGIKGLPGGRPGRQVQGHHTLVQDQDGYRILLVQDAVQGDAVRLAGEVSFAQLYAVADGLRLP